MDEMDDMKVKLQLMHYVILIAVLLGGWILLQGILKDVLVTAGAWGLLFIGSDQLLHKYFLYEGFMWEE